MFRNLVLWRCASGAVKCDFPTYISRYTSPNKNFEYSYPHSNALLQFPLKLKPCQPLARHPMECDIINDVKLFPTVYCRIYSCKCLMLPIQMSRYKSKCIRIMKLHRCFDWRSEVLNRYKPSILFVGHRQIVQNLIRRRKMRPLIRFSTVCLQKFHLKIEYHPTTLKLEIDSSN